MIHYYMILLSNIVKQTLVQFNCGLVYPLHHFDVSSIIQNFLWSTLYDAWKCNLSYSFDNCKRCNLLFIFLLCAGHQESLY